MTILDPRGLRPHDCDPPAPSRRTSCSARPPPPSRSRAPPSRTAAATRSGTRSPRAGRRHQRRQRRRRLRPLPPLPRRRRADEEHGAADLPVLDLVVARAPRRRSAQPEGRRLLQAARRRAARRRHPAVADAVPLGPAAGAAGEGRLGEPRDRRPVHRVRARPCTTRSATASRCGRPSTSRGARRSSATPPASTRPGTTAWPRGCSPRTTCCSATGRRSRELRARDASLNLGITLNLTVADPVDPATTRATSTRPAASTGSSTAGSSTRSSAASIPPTWSRTSVRWTLPRPRRSRPRSARRPRDDLGAARHPGRELLPRRARRRPMPRRTRRIGGDAPTDRRGASPFPSQEGIHCTSAGCRARR